MISSNLEKSKTKEYLRIENFLVIKKAELEVKKINIIIGEQSTGKSIIAKILYFFQDILNSILIPAVINNQNQREFKKNILDEFEKLFPKYLWVKTEFCLLYTIEKFTLSIEQKKDKSGRFRVNCIYNDYFKKNYKKMIQSLEIKDIKNQKITIKQYKIFQTNLKKFVNQNSQEQYFYDIIFIPANRSFFVNIQNKIFSLLAHNIDIDPFMKEFGSFYEISKSIYNYWKSKDLDDNDEFIIKKINNIFETIISGKYSYENKQDWIYLKESNKRINLINASSGQQETLPMLLILYYISFMENEDYPIRCFVEEPEAHLFPSAQKEIVNLFTLLYKYKNTSFFITTHSPYILTSFNNLIMAGNVINETNKKEEDFELSINYDDVSAYTIKKGKLESILDSEVNLIGINDLDSVSDILNEEFEDLLDQKINAELISNQS